MTQDGPKDIFDTHRQSLHRARAHTIRTRDPKADIVSELMAEEIIARLEWVTRDFREALIIGNAPKSLLDALADRDIAATLCDIVPVDGTDPVKLDRWDILPETIGRPDLVISLGILDAVNDLPGLLIQIRRALKPDGLFLGAMLGAGSMSRLKAAMIAADEAKATPHIHPQIDVRAAGNLLSRCGFTMPVTDSDSMRLRYSDMMGLVRDIRAFGGTNALAGALYPVSKSGLIAAFRNFANQADDDGKTAEQLEFIWISGWAPSPDQPKPARRGSATASLADALRKKPE
ncbi:SAM-dependent methyltransferase [Alterisphingorhabdus coralli]|uniref:SAM-dependent methyltransferase n=1 Tax=Alterisphingorhabdus coralli TaxID=3071408 RepID=A0AA97I0D9_9SPHN|nr:SAM-dependent methyltransferase [Parasphingorhabdus sp. SCSIO 66989]WOE74298.1 SAM-dependent methyltransferase [Parasphingorhabdus sp. SCSIO 66989]